MSKKKAQIFFAIGLTTLTIVGGGWGAYSLGNQSGYKSGFRKAIEQEIEAQYKPAVSSDPVSLSLDLEGVLRGLAQTGEARPTHPFQNSVEQIHKSMLSAMVKRYGLSDAEAKEVFQEYETLKPRVVSLYFQELQAMKKNRTTLPAQTLVSLETYAVANDFSVILADKTCLLFSSLMGFSSIATGNKLMLDGSCKFIAKGLVEPLAQAMKDKGLVIDITESQYKLQEHTRTAIAELAVAEDRLDETLNRTFTRRMLEGTWFAFDSNANLTVRASGAIKAGFALHEHYNIRIDHVSKALYVTLPKAKVLSKDISFEILNDENGYFVSVTTEKRNQTFAELRWQLEQKAMEGGILKAAEERAVNLIRVFYSPITYLPGSPYRVEVQFEEGQ